MSGSICLRRAVHATSRSTKPLLSAGALLNGTSSSSLPLPQASHRQYATATTTTTTTTTAATVSTTSTRSNGAPQTFNDGFEDSSILEKKNRQRLERIVKKQLEHMEDPWHIAQYVEQTLKRDRFDEALLLTQKASRDRQVVVAWNHLIDYQLTKDRIKPAIKLYNEMKKRGQLPNVQTFTIIFRGCAKSNHPSLAVAEAIKHYNILLSDSRLQPNSIHLNAVLNVCARAGDLDSMFLMVDTINDSTRAPTAYTYTTIFNAMRHQAIQSIKDVSEEQQMANLQKIIDRAKSIWAEVVDKWRRGRLIIDEELVCAMGRLLLMSRNREEKRDILDLFQQTMNIPNLAKSPDTDAVQDPDMQNIAASGSPSKFVPATKAVYAVPGRNTLALVLTILASAKLTTCGMKYWNLMVHHYGVVPDSDNWLRLFGMLKVARASTQAASILDILPDEHLGPKPFRIAMEACVRDNINQHAVANSNRVLDSMLNRTSIPDLHALRLYLRVALVSHYHMREKAQRGDEVTAKREYGMQITSALSRLWEPYKSTHYHYFKSPKPDTRPKDDTRLGELYNGKREVIALARHMFSAFNKVINERMLPDQDLRKLRPIGAKINREIQSFYSNRDELEPKLRRKSPGIEADDGAAEAAEVEEEVSIKRGGDFIWNTTRPVEIMTREERRRSGREEKKSIEKDEKKNLW